MLSAKRNYFTSILNWNPVVQKKDIVLGCLVHMFNIGFNHKRILVGSNTLRHSKQIVLSKLAHVQNAHRLNPKGRIMDVWEHIDAKTLPNFNSNFVPYHLFTKGY